MDQHGRERHKAAHLVQRHCLRDGDLAQAYIGSYGPRLRPVRTQTGWRSAGGAAHQPDGEINEQLAFTRASHGPTPRCCNLPAGLPSSASLIKDGPTQSGRSPLGEPMYTFWHCRRH